MPDRITAAKRVIDRFIAQRRSDRIGLVIFGKRGLHAVPAHARHRALAAACSTDVRIGLVDGQGTAIGNALGTAINRLRKSTAKSKVIVLVTDGDDNASRLDPRKAAKFAQTFGVKVFTILIGRDTLAAEAPPGQRPLRQLRAPAAALSGQPEAARGDRRDHRRHALSRPPTPRRSSSASRRSSRISTARKLKAQTPHYAELYPMLGGAGAAR